PILHFVFLRADWKTKHDLGLSVELVVEVVKQGSPRPLLTNGHVFTHTHTHPDPCTCHTSTHTLSHPNIHTHMAKTTTKRRRQAIQLNKCFIPLQMWLVRESVVSSECASCE